MNAINKKNRNIGRNFTPHPGVIGVVLRSHAS